MALADVLYVIFRHKWKIALISGAGIVATAVLPLVRPIPYQSEAKLLIKYVLETKSPGQLVASDSSGVKTIDAGESALNTELEILTSLDLAQQVADTLGPEKSGQRRAALRATIMTLSVLVRIGRRWKTS